MGIELSVQPISIPAGRCERHDRSELWIIYALVFGTVLLGVQGLYVLLFKARQEKDAINRRLALTAQLNNPNEVLEACAGSGASSS